MGRSKLMRYIGSVAFAGILAASGAAVFAEDAPAPKDNKSAPVKEDGKVLEGPRADKEKGGMGRKGFAGEGRGQKPGGPGGPFGKAGIEFVRDTLDSLNLSDDQKAKVRTILEDTRKSHEEFRSKNEATLKSLHEEAKAAREAGDREKARAAMEKAEKLMENAPRPGAAIDKIKGVLTADQSKKLDEAIEAKKKELHEQGEKRRAEMEKNGEKPGGKGGEKMNEIRERRREGEKDKMMDGEKKSPPANDKGTSDKLNL